MFGEMFFCIIVAVCAQKVEVMKLLSNSCKNIKFVEINVTLCYCFSIFRGH